MKKSDWQYLVDTLLFICMFGIAFIGILMGFFLAEGPTVRESAKYFLGLHRHQWGDIHLYLSLVFILLIIIHLMLSWSWIKGKAQNLFKKRWNTMIMVTVLLAVFVIVVFWTFMPKYPLSYENYGSGARARSQGQFPPEDFINDELGYLTIIGNMTLAEVEKITGIPAEVLTQKLGLPSRTSPDETLGQLRKKHGFSLVEARAAISALLQIEQDETSNPSVLEETPQKTHPLMQENSDELEGEQKPTRGRLSEDLSGILITGRITLREIEEETGVPARAIANILGLSQNISTDVSLGRLRRRYGFAMQDVRDAIASLMEKK